MRLAARVQEGRRKGERVSGRGDGGREDREGGTDGEDGIVWVAAATAASRAAMAHDVTAGYSATTASSAAVPTTADNLQGALGATGVAAGDVGAGAGERAAGMEIGVAEAVTTEARVSAAAMGAGDLAGTRRNLEATAAVATTAKRQRVENKYPGIVGGIESGHSLDGNRQLSTSQPLSGVDGGHSLAGGRQLGTSQPIGGVGSGIYDISLWEAVDVMVGSNDASDGSGPAVLQYLRFGV